MPDDKSQSGGQDRKRISLSQEYEVRDWAKKFNVTPEQLEAAVRAVGNDAAAVEEHLTRTGSPDALQVFLDSGSIVAHGADSGFELLRRHVELLRPVANLVLLGEADAFAVLAAGLGFVVGHVGS